MNLVLAVLCKCFDLCMGSDHPCNYLDLIDQKYDFADLKSVHSALLCMLLGREHLKEAEHYHLSDRLMYRDFVGLFHQFDILPDKHFQKLKNHQHSFFLHNFLSLVDIAVWHWI